MHRQGSEGEERLLLVCGRTSWPRYPIATFLPSLFRRAPWTKEFAVWIEQGKRGHGVMGKGRAHITPFPYISPMTGGILSLYYIDNGNERFLHPRTEYASTRPHPQIPCLFPLPLSAESDRSACPNFNTAGEQSKRTISPAPTQHEYGSLPSNVGLPFWSGTSYDKSSNSPHTRGRLATAVSSRYIHSISTTQAKAMTKVSPGII